MLSARATVRMRFEWWAALHAFRSGTLRCAIREFPRQVAVKELSGYVKAWTLNNTSMS